MPLPPDTHETPNWLTASIAGVVWKITPTCREVARLTSEGRDRTLPLGMRMRLAVHRGFCVWCERYAKQLELLHEASHRLPEHLDEVVGQTLDSEAKARMKRALR